MLLTVKVTPSAGKSEIGEFRDGVLRVKVAAAPEDGKANAALIALLARTAGCAKRDVTITRGEKSRLKTVSIAGLESLCGGGKV